MKTIKRYIITCISFYYISFIALFFSFIDEFIQISQIYQYTKDREVNYTFITMENGNIADSSFEKSFKEAVLIPISSYIRDTDDIYHLDAPKINIYKKGMEHFLKNNKAWPRVF